MRTILAVGLFALSIALVVSPPTLAGPFEDGIAAYQRGDYATALKLWRPLAEQGNATAQFNLGVMYFEGQGVERNYVEAEKWYRKAAEQGMVQAQGNLAFMYEVARGVEQDDAEAVKWYLLAADNGHPGAQYNLGVRYSIGEGVPKDLVRSYMWFSLAAARGVAEVAEQRLAAVAEKMTPDQIAEAKRLVKEWKAKHSQ